ncbi:MAG: hypothetical protein FJX72_13125 [Armatimonadetes bacterium]|nr:hypothetical protein [Armatimonadota bacterium]
MIIGIGACVVLAAAIMAQTRPKTGAASAKTRKGAASRSAGVPPATVAERKPLSYYTSGVRGDLFVMPGAKEPVLVRPEPPKPEPPAPAPVVIDPFADYAYTGTVTMGEEHVALIENAKTKEGMYVRRGDQFLGGTVSEISDKGVTVSVAGSAKTLYKTEEYKLTPLDKDASFRAPAQGPGGPGMPGMGGPFGMGGGMPGMPGGGMGPAGMQALSPEMQQRIQQRFQGMSPEQMQNMRNRFMNRSFEGGGRRRRFF